jgi:hypothetical protein
MTGMSSYSISLLANLNARGQLNSEINMDDIATPQIAVGSPPPQQTDEGGKLPSLIQAVSVIASGTSVVNAVQLGASIIEEAQNMTVETLTIPAQIGITEIHAAV